MLELKKLYIINFRSIESQVINIGKNKTVFVGKNGSGKTVILKALEKLLNSKKIKEKDFRNKDKELLIEAIFEYKGKEVVVKSSSIIEKGDVKTKSNDDKLETKKLLDKINLIYIPSDRKINKENKENGFSKLIDLILKNKENRKDSKEIESIERFMSMKKNSGEEKTTFLISLLKLYLYSINETNNSDFNIFIMDQPENFLHPHATKMIDDIIQDIGELENTQVLYSTHSSELVSNFRKGKYEISDIVFVKNENGKTHTKKIENYNGRYDKIMINLIFKNADIFFSDAVILVEGETEKISIPNIYENTTWKNYIDFKHKNLSKEEKLNYFNLNYKNISVIDVGGKGALYEWFVFASELFGKENVVAVIDRDDNFYIDRDMIIKSIRKVYKTGKVFENDFKKYNWIVLDGEFENYYKVDSIKTYLTEVITKRAEEFGDDFDKEKFDQSLEKLDSKLSNLKNAKKISSVYEHIFSSYFRKYSKPTIAFNLSTWLTENNGYDENLFKIFAKVIEKFEKKAKAAS